MKYSIILLAVIIFCLTAMPSFAQSGMKRSESHSQPGRTNKGDEMCCTTDNGPATHNTNSIFQLDSKWQDQYGKTIRLSDLAGKITIIAMFYSHCTYACPLTINDMKTVEEKLPSGLRDNVRFVLVSFDTYRDTPAVLRKLTEESRLTGRNWILLTGSAYDVRTLAAVFGVSYKREKNGDYIHSSQISVLDESGKIIYKHLGLNQSVDDIVEVTEKSSGEAATK